jgi:hypothetical protein
MRAVHKSECPGGAGHCQNRISDVPHRAADLIVAGNNCEDNSRAKFVVLNCQQHVADSSTVPTLSAYFNGFSSSVWQRVEALENRLRSWGEGHD